MFSQLKTVGRAEAFGELAIGEMGQLEVKDETKSMTLVDRVAIVVRGIRRGLPAVWSTTLAI